MTVCVWVKSQHWICTTNHGGSFKHVTRALKPRCSSDWALKWLDLNQTECGIVVGGGKCWCEYNCRHCVIVQSSPENQQYGVEVTTCWNFVWTIQADIVTTTQPNTKEWLFKFWVLSQSASLIFVFTVICSAYYGVAETQSAADYMSLWWVSWASWGALELVCTTVHEPRWSCSN